MNKELENDLRLIMAEDLKHDHPRVISNYEKRNDALTRIKKALSIPQLDSKTEMLFDIRNNNEITCISHLGEYSYKITSKGWRELKQVFSNQQKEIQRRKNAFKTQGNILTRQKQGLQSKLDKIKEIISKHRSGEVIKLLINNIIKEVTK